MDFYCPAAKLVIELDGSQHYEEDGRAKDKERDSYLSGIGITVIRFSNRDIKTRFNDVCDYISYCLKR